jgi:hypothetical protein
MQRLGGETMVLYADLRERLEIFEALRGIASLPGDFVTKTVSGRVYHYFQATLVGGRSQIYLGPDSDEVRRLIAAKLAGSGGVQADEALLQRLAAQVTAGGARPVLPDMARIVKRLADSGVFRVGGVLVGTVAFQVLGPHLGIDWANALRTTQDVDLAADTIALAIPDLQADVPAALNALEMGFFPVPRLSRSEPSTSYAIRGRTLRVDLLTPMRKGQSAPVFLRRLNAAALPLRYLDYLIADPVDAVLLAGMPCLVKVPQPARYALHKLIISQERDVASAAKKQKDLQQAISLIEVLRADRPGDLQLARTALIEHGPGWVRKVEAACREAQLEW